jgi:hypothetical protein
LHLLVALSCKYNPQTLPPPPLLILPSHTHTHSQLQPALHGIHRHKTSHQKLRPKTLPPPLHLLAPSQL